MLKRKGDESLLEITFIRHGQVESNARGAHIGKTNKPLNMTGIRQAKETALRLENEKFDAIYTSPLERAKYTADLIREKTGGRVVLDDGLKEWNFGIFDDLTDEAIKDKYPKEAEKWQYDRWEYKIPDGESWKEASRRHTDAIDGIIKKHPNGGSICVVTHMCTLRDIFCHLLGMDPRQGSKFYIKNALINKIIVTDENYAVLTALNA